jgi:hypothetical protein
MKIGITNVYVFGGSSRRPHHSSGEAGDEELAIMYRPIASTISCLLSSLPLMSQTSCRA